MIRALLSYFTPVCIAAMAALITESVGVLNIAIEGLILLGAFTAYIATALTGSLLVGVLSAAAITMLVSLLYGWTTLVHRGNIFITGLAMNILIPGISSMISSVAFGTRGVIRIPGYPTLQQIGPMTWFTIFAFLLYPIMRYMLFHTPVGIRMRACGMDLRAYEIRGGRPLRTRVAAFGLSGFLAGIAGAYLTSSLGAYVPNVSAGKGWIALAALYLGRRTPGGAALACLFFAAAETAANTAQGSFNLPSSLFLGFPYLMTFLALLLSGYWTKKRGSGSAFL